MTNGNASPTAAAAFEKACREYYSDEPDLGCFFDALYAEFEQLGADYDERVKNADLYGDEDNEFAGDAIYEEALRAKAAYADLCEKHPAAWQLASTFRPRGY